MNFVLSETFHCFRWKEKWDIFKGFLPNVLGVLKQIFIGVYLVAKFIALPYSKNDAKICWTMGKVGWLILENFLINWLLDGANYSCNDDDETLEKLSTDNVSNLTKKCYNCRLSRLISRLRSAEAKLNGKLLSAPNWPDP